MSPRFRIFILMMTRTRLDMLMSYSLKTNFARTTNFNHTYIYFNKNCSNVEFDTLRY